MRATYVQLKFYLLSFSLAEKNIHLTNNDQNKNDEYNSDY